MRSGRKKPLKVYSMALLHIHKIFLILCISLPDHISFNLSADGLGKFLDKFHHPWILIGCGNLFDMGLQLLNKLIATLLPLCQDHGGLNHLAPDFIGYCSNRTFQYGGVRDQSTFNFKRTNAISRAFNYIVRPANKPIVTGLIAPGDITA